MSVFRLPDLGEGLREAELVAWHVAAGDRVVAGQPLATVETDKALVEVTSPWAGRIARLVAAPGDRVAVGEALAEIEDGDARADAGTVVGELPGEGGARAAAAGGERGPGARGGERRAPEMRGGVRATPRVRALAARLGVDLAGVPPSGPGGTVTEADVERAAGGGTVAEGGAPEAPPDGELAPGFEPLRGVRLAMARNMARAGAGVVPATVTDEAEVDRWPADADVTVRLLRAVAAGCAAAPALNAWLDGRRLARRLHGRVDVAVAVQTADGLFAPVVRDVARRDAAELGRELAAVAARVRARALAPEDLRGATIALSNFGTLGGRHAALVVVPPQVAILGAGRIAPRVIAVGGAPAVRRVLPLSLSFDHRAATGAEAARFLAAAIAHLEGGGTP